MTKRVLITGANGQLGHEMRNVLDGDDRFEAIFTDVAELDICDAEAVNRAVADNRVDYIVNCAAYTQVDKAEDNVELCRKINATAVENLARAAAAVTGFGAGGSGHVQQTDSIRNRRVGSNGQTAYQRAA